MAFVFTAAQAKAADAFVIESLGLPGLVLMENAGRGIADIVLSVLERTGRPLEHACVAVVCGAGQNGGDGFVIARHLALSGVRVAVHLCMQPAKLKGDGAVNLQVLEAMGVVPVHDRSSLADEDAWRAHLAAAQVVVDAIFGTGLNADVTGVPAAAIRAINNLPAAVKRVAVDVPSGRDADSAMVRGVAVAADITATVATAKLGVVVDASAAVGELRVVDLGAPQRMFAELAPYAYTIDEALVRRLLPHHAADAHKGSRGHVLLVAGSQGKTGAAALAARAAMRAGAGMASVATTRAAQAALDAKLWEVMSLPYAEGDDADEGSFSICEAMAARCKAVALGPGIPTGPGMQALVRALAVELPLPMVIDADGLNHLGTNVNILKAAAGPRVLTPHPGEMARLLGVSIPQVQENRVACVRKLAAASGAVTVLKGARSLIAEPDGTLYVSLTASASLGTAGSGDVLTGAVAALLGQGASALAAAVVGVHAHGVAAAIACSHLGLANLVAGDLPDAIAKVLHALAQP